MLKGKKVGKMVALLLMVVCTSMILTACGNRKVKFEGVTTKRFEKDLNKLRTLTLMSMREKKYDTNIDDIIEKMNSIDYTKKLTTQEVIILANLNKSIDDFKKDLSTGKKLISSYTFDDLNWLLQATTEKP